MCNMNGAGIRRAGCAEKSDVQIAEWADRVAEANTTNAALRARVAELEGEIARFKTMSTVEIMCENTNVNAHVREWEVRCLRAEQQLATVTAERDELLDEVRKLDALEAMGVDNWAGYDDAMKSLNR